MKGAVNTGPRFLHGLSRPSKASNTRLLRARRVSSISRNPRCCIFRYSRPRAPARNDLERNAQLAAKGADLRTSRASMAGYVRAGRRQLVLLSGRTPERRIGGICQRGTLYDGDLSGFGGELNKIYLLREYQPQGLGRRVVDTSPAVFLAKGLHQWSCSARLPTHPVGSGKPSRESGYTLPTASSMAGTDGVICGASRRYVSSNSTFTEV